MNNFQKIFAAVLIFGGLALGAFVSSQPSEPSKGNCITDLGSPPDKPDLCK